MSDEAFWLLVNVAVGVVAIVSNVVVYRIVTRPFRKRR